MRRLLSGALVLGLASCSAPTPPATPTRAEGAVAAPPPAPPVRTAAEELGLVGAWRGTATQSDGSTYRVLLRVNATGGASRYPTFSCGGRLVPTGREGSAVIYREDLTYGATVDNRQGCANGGTIALSLSGDTLNWVWRDHPDFPGLSAQASLQREETAPPN